MNYYKILTQKKYMKYSLSIFVLGFLCTIIAISIIKITIMLNLDKKFVKNSVHTYNYLLDTKYKVYLKPNNFITNQYLDINNSYITELIDYIDINFSYKYNSLNNANINYSYNIVATVLGRYSETPDSVKKSTIWVKDYILKNPTSNKLISNQFSISEPVKLDLAYFNSEVNKFEQTLGINLESSLIIKLNVSINGLINGKNFNKQYTNNITIPLNVKVFDISNTNSDQKIENIEKTTEVTNVIDNSKLFIYSIIIAICMVLATLFIKYFILVNTKSKSEKFINKIFKEYENRIVKVINKPDFTNMECVDISSFDEILILSDEFNFPILFWQDKIEKFIIFYIIKDNLAYRFIFVN